MSKKSEWLDTWRNGCSFAVSDHEHPGGCEECPDRPECDGIYKKAKRNNFWLGLAIGIAIGFLYGWFSIWATYTELEKQSRAREAELQQIKHILLSWEGMTKEYNEIVEWNKKAIIKPVVITTITEEQ